MVISQTSMTCPHYMVSIASYYCIYRYWYYFVIMPTGKEDHLQPIDVTLWTASMHASESRPPPPLCPIPFKHIASAILRNDYHLNLSDITHSNCRDF